MAYSVDKGEVGFGGGTVTRDKSRMGPDDNQNTTTTTSTTPTTKQGISFGSFLDSLSNFSANKNYQKNLSLMNKYDKFNFMDPITPEQYGLDSLAVKNQFKQDQPDFGSFLENPLNSLIGGTYNTLGTMQTFGLPTIAKQTFDIISKKPIGGATLSGYTMPENFFEKNDLASMYKDGVDQRSLGSAFKSILNDKFGTNFDEDAGRFIDQNKMLAAGAKLNSITGLTDSFIEKGLKEGFFENPEKAYNAYVSKKLQEAETDFNTKGPEKQPVPIATVDPNLNKFTEEQLMAYQEYLRRGYPPEMAEYLVTTLS